jgi:hypothetical protein
VRQGRWRGASEGPCGDAIEARRRSSAAPTIFSAAVSLGLKTLRSLVTMAAFLAAVGSAFAAAPAGAATTPADPTIEFSHTFTSTGAPQELRAPAGVAGMTTRAVGGRGGANGSKAGGLAAEVQGVVPTEPGQAVWVLVGGNANGTEGGYNGGAGLPFNGYALGGGGGGATDIRKIYPGDSGSLESRLIVAGGGGGAGGLGNGSGVKLNAAGGNADTADTADGAGARAESGGPDNTVGSGGYGGDAGGPSAGGNGGEGGYPYAGGCGAHGGNGATGALGSGGQGGQGPTNAPTGWGGGGGGGVYGGGGGGAGGEVTCSSEVVVLSGGGGGGGSSLAPNGGSVAVDGNSASTPELSVHYSIPGTVLSGPSGYIASTEPSFAVSSEASDVHFECRLAPAAGPAPTVEPVFEPCGAEPTLGPLAQSIYTFEARAANSEGNFDPTPAALEFEVLTSPPVIVEVSGPTSTTETQPTFTFVGGSIAPITFECAFDGAAPGLCSGADSDRPAEPLGLGEHTFSVTPTDAAGNVGLPVTRTFVISPEPAQGSTTTTAGSTAGPSPAPAGSTAKPAATPVAPTIKLGKVKLNAKKGSATVIATVNGPGELRLKGANVKAATVKATRVGSVTITVAATPKALEQLKAKGALTARVTVTFTAAAGGTATASKTVRLLQKRPVRGRPHR